MVACRSSKANVRVRFPLTAPKPPKYRRRYAPLVWERAWVQLPEVAPLLLNFCLFCLMNIFVSDPNPVVSARNLDDVRLNKMILESAQLLSTAMTMRGSKHAPYKVTHVNHPVAIWTRTTKGNYHWLYQHFVALLSEFYRRRGKMHACHKHSTKLRWGIDLMPKGGLQPFSNSSYYKTMDNVPLAYRLTLLDKWKNDILEGRPPTWKMRGKPAWCPQSLDRT